MAAMRAALHDEYGAPHVIYEGTLPLPDIGEHDVLVRVLAATVNGGDLLMRSGRLRVITGKRFPRQVGVDVVGDVVRTGGGVRGYQPGDRVWGVLPPGSSNGTAAEYVAVPARHLSTAPENLNAAEAASLLAGATTALVGLRDKANLEPGERLLVRGAGGGVGSLAVQVGKHLGAHVTALARSAQEATLRSLGADVVLDYRSTPISDLGSYDVVFDARGTELASLRRRLTPSGRMVTIAFDEARLLSSFGFIAVSALFGRRRVRFFSGRPTTALLDEVRELAAEESIRPIVHSLHPLSQVSTAHTVLESGGVFGKIVIRP